MLSIIQKNFALKLVSLTLAIVGWGYFRFANNPVIAARFDQQVSVPITAIHVPVGFLVHFTDKEAVVTIAPKRGAQPIKPDDIKAVLDLANLNSGVYNIPIELVAPKIAVQSLSPASVTLTVERIDQKSFTLAPHYTGSANRGIVAAGIQVAPLSAQVRGGQDDLARVAAVRVDVPLPGSPTHLDAMVRPVAVDALGAEVQSVQVAPNLVRVRVDFIAGSQH